VQKDRLVLVVSDDPEEQERSVAAVLDLGHAVLCAGTAGHALEVLAENPSLDVVVCGIEAAGTGEGGLMRQLRASRPDVAVLDAYTFLEWVERTNAEPEDELAADRQVTERGRYARLLA
jgi:CheY-like chemotaxis protein